MTDETPAAGVVPAPAAPAEVTALAAPVAVASLLDGDGPAPAAPVAPVPEPAAEAPTWFYAEGVPGKGEPPAYYLADKYATLDKQAQAYPELQKMLGAFTGAPKEGKYETPKVPEGLEGEFFPDHPIFDKFSKWAIDHQVSQDGYNSVLGMLAEYEASRVPDKVEILKEIGENAEERLTAIKQWANANLTAEEYGLLKVAFAPSEQTAAMVKAVEKLIAKTRVVAPKPGQDVTAGIDTLDSIKAEHAKKGPDGKRVYDSDPKYREMIENKYRAYYEKRGAA